MACNALNLQFRTVGAWGATVPPPFLTDQLTLYSNRGADYAHPITKGQIKPKADLRAIDSPKKRTDEFVFSP